MLNWFSAKYKTSKFNVKVDKSCMETSEEIETIVTTKSTNKPMKCTVSKRLGPGGDASAKLFKCLRRERLTLLWKWCKICNNFCPPRAHHCKVQRIYVFCLFTKKYILQISVKFCVHQALNIMARLHTRRRVWVRIPVPGDIPMATVVQCRKFTLDQDKNRHLSLIGYCTLFWDRAPSPERYPYM